LSIADQIPQKGDRIELGQPRNGVRLRGTVFYSDQLQILVKWDNGRSESLRPGVDRVRILRADDSPDGRG
jgi:hypothetical protein